MRRISFLQWFSLSSTVFHSLLGSVTAVGGTTGIPEVAAFFSGGGFSNYVSSCSTGLSVARPLAVL